MKKLAFGDGSVYVTLSIAEFTSLSNQTPADVSDGTNISLVSIKHKLDLVDSKTAELLELKTLALAMANKLTEIGI